MKKFVFAFVVSVGCFTYVTAVANEGSALMSKAEYLKECKKMLREAQPNKDPKDVDMLCADPYLKGQPHESKEDKARRERLLKETDKSKATMIRNLGPMPEPKSMEPMDMAEYLKECKKMILESDPGKDPKDVQMLCSDPYLKGKENESYEDQIRRKRLLKETDKAKQQIMEKHLAPAPAKAGAGAR